VRKAKKKKRTMERYCVYMTADTIGGKICTFSVVYFSENTGGLYIDTRYFNGVHETVHFPTSTPFQDHF